MKYRKKPVVVVIEAIQFNGKNVEDCLDFGGEDSPICWECNVIDGLSLGAVGGNLIIETLEGNMTVSLNDFIIKGVKGEFYPCKPDIFEMTYEKVEEINQ